MRSMVLRKRKLMTSMSLVFGRYRLERKWPESNINASKITSENLSGSLLLCRRVKVFRVLRR